MKRAIVEMLVKKF